MQRDEKPLWLKLKDVPLIGNLRFNPVVVILSSLFIWTLTLVCAVRRDLHLPFSKIIVAINSGFSWLFVLGHNVWALFIVYVYFR